MNTTPTTAAPFKEASLLECYDRMKAVLDALVKQRLTAEMDEDQREHADYEGAYNHIVTLAREALA